MSMRRKPARIASLAATALLASFVSCRDLTAPAPQRIISPPPAPPSLDLATSTAQVLVGAGYIASCSVTTDDATSALLDNIPGTVFTTGDNALTSGSDADYKNCYDPSWGRHKARTRPAVGSKDYGTTNALGYFHYFGAAGGDSAKYYYSYDLNDWHIVVLNTKASISATSAQVKWLKADLLASPKQCTVAIFNRPYYSSPSGTYTSLKPVWDVLYSFGVELAVNGYNRDYERFAPQDANGQRDDARGVREIIVGTGGAQTASFSSIAANSEVRDTKTFGVLKLTLDAGTYGWEFIPVPGKTFTDAGTGTCHDGPPPVANAGSAQAGESSVTFDGSLSTDPQGELPLTYAWNFGDGTTGTGVTPTHEYAADGVYTVQLVVTDSKGNSSAPATTTATIQNLPPVVDAGQNQSLLIGNLATVSATFTDLGINDGPWSYRIEWGDGTADDVGSVAFQPGPIVASHMYAAVGTYTARVFVTDIQGAEGQDDVSIQVRQPGSGEVLLLAGDIASCSQTRDELTAQILDTIPGTVFTLGDASYPNGTASEYTNCYGPTWGRSLSRTYEVLGNHEYNTAGALPTYDYFGDRAGPRGKGFYSVNIGDWHVVVINDNISMSSGSEQDKWLVADLAANTRSCTLALWHQPRYRSSNDGSGERTSRKILWDRLYAAGAEIVMSGHQHFYERFAPMDNLGNLNDATGIREFIVGTGGESTSLPTTTIAKNSEVRSDAFGVMKLTLLPGSFEWKFIPMKGYTFSDTGTGTCH